MTSSMKFTFDFSKKGRNIYLLRSQEAVMNHK